MDGIAEQLGKPANVEELLRGDSIESGGTAAWEQELEKRLAVAAFLASTSVFPPDVVLPQLDQLLPEAKAIATRVYPRYRSAFMNRLMQALQSADPEKQRRASMALAEARSRVRGIPQLQDLCQQLSDVEPPPTPPPPPRPST